MEVPKYLQVLWAGKWLLAVGLVVAAACGFFAGYTIQDGTVVPRAEQNYTASTTVLVSSSTQPMYQAVIPGQELVEGQTQPTDVDLTSKAILYAYLVSGVQMRTQVESEVGEFSETDQLRALRRTTQPGGDESFPGRYTLPIIDVVGLSTDPARAQAISTIATTNFLAQVVSDQDAAQIPPDDRVTLDILDESAPVAVEGSNPLIPVIVAFLGVFLLFVAAVFIVAGARSSRRAKRARRSTARSVGEPHDESPAELEEPATEPIVGRRSLQRRSRSSDADSEELVGSEEQTPARVS